MENNKENQEMRESEEKETSVSREITRDSLKSSSRDGGRENFEEVVVNIGRVTKVVKGGRRFRFNALVVVGDRNGTVGFGLGKAKEVPDAIKKAVDDAFKNLVKVNIKGTTITHDIENKYNSSRILLRPASEGTGVIAGGSARPVIELAGIKDILTKSLGSNNPYNVVRATVDALRKIKA